MSHRVKKCTIGAIVLGVLGGISSVSKAMRIGDITNWTGTGSNMAGLIIDWSPPEVLNNSSITPPATEVALAWGYRFDGTATGQQMLDAIIAADPHLFGAAQYGGSFVEGLGYDINKTGVIGLTDGTTTFQASDLTGGILNVDSHPAYNPDTFHPLDASDLFWGGYYGANWETWTADGTNPTRGSNTYWTPSDPLNPFDGSQGDWTYASFGLGGVTVTNDSWLGFTVARGGDEFGTTDAGTTAYNNDKQAPIDSAVAAAPVPEPASLALLGLGGLFALSRRRRRTASAVAGICAGLAVLPQAARADYVYNSTDFATTVVSSTISGANPYFNPTALLDQPPLTFNNSANPNVQQSERAKIVEAPVNYDLSGNPVLTELPFFPNTTQVTVQMGRPISHDDGHLYGDDLIVFGNSFFLSSGTTVSDATNLNTLSLTGTMFSHPVQVSVSPDNVNWFLFPLTTGLQPYNAYKWNDATASWTTEEMNPTVPLNPSLYTGSFAGTSAASVLDAYGNSAGGTAFNLENAVDSSGNTLAQDGFSEIDYVRVASTSSGYAVVTGISAVSPQPLITEFPEPASTTALAIAGMSLLRRQRSELPTRL